MESGSLLAWFPWLAVLIFLAEMSVVTLGTMRIIFVARGRKLLAPVLGFFEIVIWLFAIGQIMQNLTDLGCYAGFAAGFTLGNYLGIWVERKLAIGSLLVRIITHREARDLTEALQADRFGVTLLKGQGAKGPVEMVFTVIRRKDLQRVLGIVERFDPRAFCSVDEIVSASQGIFPSRQEGGVPHVRRWRFSGMLTGTAFLRRPFPEAETDEPDSLSAENLALRDLFSEG